MESTFRSIVSLWSSFGFHTKSTFPHRQNAPQMIIEKERKKNRSGNYSDFEWIFQQFKILVIITNCHNMQHRTLPEYEIFWLKSFNGRIKTVYSFEVRCTYSSLLWNWIFQLRQQSYSSMRDFFRCHVQLIVLCVSGCFFFPHSFPFYHSLDSRKPVTLCVACLYALLLF